MIHRSWFQIAPALTVLVLAPLLLCAGTPVAGSQYRSDRILVQPKRGVPAGSLDGFHRVQRTTVHRATSRKTDLQILNVPVGTDIPGLIERYRRSGLVEFAEPDYRVRAAGTDPNDPKYLDGTLWGLHNVGQNGGTADADIDAPEAWDIRTSAGNIVVAVLDTGIRASHEDLAPNLWAHPLDGGHGWNALSGTNNPLDDEGHGSLVSGIIGAAGNNGKGVVGVAWDVQLMACKCLDSSGNGSISDLIACIDYARTNGARIINASLVVEEFSQALSNAVLRTRDAGILFVASAGNSSANVDEAPFFPAGFDFDNIISVGYSTRDDGMGSDSNFGPTSVDLFAPGQAMYSTFWVADNFYLGGQFLSGSSFSAPYVAGTLALMLAKFAGETHTEIIARLLAGVDSVPALAGTCVTGGRLNVRNALSPPVVLTALPSTPGAPFRLRISGGPGRIFVILSTSDFSAWTPVEVNTTGPDGYYEFVDADSTNAPRRFYQVFAQP